MFRLVMFLDRARMTRAALDVKACIFCQSQPLIHHKGLFASARFSNRRTENPTVNAQKRKVLDAQRLRADADRRNRDGYFKLTNSQKVLLLKPTTANAVIEDFYHQKNASGHGQYIRRLAKKYNLDIEDLAALAIVTFRVPDLPDPEKRAQLPPSQHQKIAGLMLQGCAENEDPLAIVQILSAVYLSHSSSDGSFREIASLFPSSEIAKYRKTLESLGEKAATFELGLEILTLQGLFLEREGQKQKAKGLYRKAIQVGHMEFNPKSKHPMLLPLVAPWNALGYLLKADPTPEAQAEAKTYFEKGAVEGDDPLSCFELAAFEPRSSPKWLQFTTKAAASGHIPAIVALANFYHEANSEDSSLVRESRMQKTLGWLLKWKPNSAALFAKEWLQAATIQGHKPSMLKLADLYEAEGSYELAIEQLQQALKPPSVANQREEWPQIVQVAKKRLAALKI